MLISYQVLVPLVRPLLISEVEKILQYHVEGSYFRVVGPQQKVMHEFSVITKPSHSSFTHFFMHYFSS